MPLEVFRRWAEEHGKDYVDDEDEFSRRFSIWKDNIDLFEQYNSEHADHWVRAHKVSSRSIVLGLFKRFKCERFELDSITITHTR